MRFLLLLLLALPANAQNLGGMDSTVCAAQGGCAWVPMHLIEQMVEQNKTLHKRVRRLEALNGCIT